MNLNLIFLIVLLAVFTKGAEDKDSIPKQDLDGAFLQSSPLVLSDKIIQDDWSSLQKQLQKRKVLRIYHEAMSEDSINKILSLPMPKLIALYFEEYSSVYEPHKRKVDRIPPVLTHRLVKTIFTSQYFPRLSVLSLKNTNIDDRYLSFLSNMTLETSINELNLQGCIIGKKGFKYLSNVKFPNLTRLFISQTNLFEEEAVDSLITIVCGTDQTKCGNKLERLSISRTSITRQPFIKLMNRLNPEPLKHLQIGVLSLIYNKRYNDGFNYTAFQVLSKRFFNLEYLDLQSSRIDDQIMTIFQNWTLPNLKTLVLSNNYYSDVGVKLWMNNKNMPKLQNLTMISTKVGDETILHLANEKFKLKKFAIGDCRLTPAGALNMSLLSTQKIQNLTLQIPLPSDTFNDLIEKNKFPSLKYLSIRSNDFLINAFTKINWAKLKQLKTLIIINTNLKESLQELLTFQQPAKVISPNLQYLFFNEAKLTDQILIYFIVSISTFFPNLKQIKIQQSFDFDGISVLSQILELVEFNDGMIFTINSLQIVKGENKYQLINLPSLVFMFYSTIQEELTYEHFYSQVPKYSSKYDFTTIEYLTLQYKDAIDLFFSIIRYAKLQQLPNLRHLSIPITVDVDFLLRELKNLHFPSLRSLQLSILVPGDANKEIVHTIADFLNQFNLLHTLYLRIIFLNDQSGFLYQKQLLESLYFPHLLELIMVEQGLQVDQLGGFIREHNQTLRFLNIGGNFLQKDFLHVLVEEKVMLKGLSLASTSFSAEQFGVLGEIDTQFFQILILALNDLTNQHIFAMLNKKPNTQIFPKLMLLDLQENDVRQEGLAALLETGIPDLFYLEVIHNNNPHFLNIILDYPTRITILNANQTEIYEMNSTLHPRSAENIGQIIISTKYFLPQDFHALARLEFSSLKTTQIEVYNVYDCQVLLDLLKINKWGKAPGIVFLNDDTGLNSSCLANITFETHLSVIQIMDAYGTAYLPEFLQILINTVSQLMYVRLTNLRLPPSFFSKLFKKPLDRVLFMTIPSNYLKDEGARELFKKSLPNIRFLDLRDNQLTDNSLELMSRAKIPQLQYLLLDGNKVGIRGIRGALSMKSKLQVITLDRCDINSQILEAISNLESQTLVAFALSYNKFGAADVLNFVSNLDRKSFPNLVFLRLLGIQYMSKVEYDEIMQVSRAKQIQIQLDPPKYMKKVNAATY